MNKRTNEWMPASDPPCPQLQRPTGYPNTPLSPGLVFPAFWVLIGPPTQLGPLTLPEFFPASVAEMDAPKTAPHAHSSLPLATLRASGLIPSRRVLMRPRAQARQPPDQGPSRSCLLEWPVPISRCWGHRPAGSGGGGGPAEQTVPAEGHSPQLPTAGGRCGRTPPRGTWGRDACEGENMKTSVCCG